MIKSKIIGGMFGFNISSNCLGPPFLNLECSYYLNARSAILDVLNAFRPITVWMPSYLCLSMLDPPRIANISVRYFPVNKLLQIEHDGWISEIKEGDLVIVIDYFGFKVPEWICGAIREKGGWILEDASQALLSTHVGKYSDFIVYSPRKFVGVPDGGILWKKTQCSLNSDKILPPSSWWIKAFEACLLRRDFDNSIADGDRKWFQLFREAAAEMPVGNFGASSLTVALLETTIDWKSVTNKRRENYLILLNDLREFALYKDLPDDVVPLGFPISIRNRDEIRKVLFEHNIYPPIHWELADAVPIQYVESHELSQHILTLICDQRYKKNDMERIIHIVKKTGISL